MHWRRLVPALALAGACSLLAVPGAAAHPPRGYTLVNSADIVVASGTQNVGDVTCPSGLVPLSGSVGIHSVSVQTSVFDSIPVPHGWEAFVNNASGAPSRSRWTSSARSSRRATRSSSLRSRRTRPESRIARW